MLLGFLVTESEDDNPRKIAIGSSLTLGRAMECDIVVDDAAVSRTHVRIHSDDGKYSWEDLGSSNGTFINGHLFQNGVLKEGDRLQIGETIFLFTTETANEEDSGDGMSIYSDRMVGWQREGSEDQAERRSEGLLRNIYHHHCVF